MKATKGRVLIKIDLSQKEKYKFSNGKEIYLARGWNYNLREDNANVAEVLDAEKIPTGSLVLIHHNATQDSYKLFSEKEDIFSIPEDMCFIYNFCGEWIPNEGFVISKRVYKPYRGLIAGIEPELVKNRMYIERGIHAGKVCVTLVNCDYCIVFFIDGKEHNIIRTRCRELTGIDVDMTKAVKNGEYLIGVNSKTSKKLMDYV